MAITASKVQIAKAAARSARPVNAGTNYGDPNIPLSYSVGPRTGSNVETAYFQWLSGIKPASVESSLARPLQDFLTSILGPQAPILPYPIDQPEAGQDRPFPRRWEYPVGYNLPRQPGSYKMVSFDTLRSLADTYSVARACIRTRIEEVIDLDYDISPTKMMHERMEQDRFLRREFEERREIARTFWRCPDPEYGTFVSWMKAVLEEIFVIDALSLYVKPTPFRRMGPFGSDLESLSLLDGSCYSNDTEVLTRRGWKRFDQIDLGIDEFATRNQESKSFEWQKGTYFHKEEWRGNLIHFTSRTVDLLVTPNHRMLCARQDGTEFIDLAEKVADRGRYLCLPSLSVWDASDIKEMSFGPTAKGSKLTMSGDEFAAFMGMYLAEGCVSSTDGGRDNIYITQSPLSKGYESFRQLLIRILGKEPCRTSGGSWTFRKKALSDYLRIFGKSYEKYVPDNILGASRRQLGIFWAYYSLGDGHIDSGRIGISTASNEMADDLQEMAQKLGYSASVVKKPIKEAVFSDGRVIREENQHQGYTIRLRSTIQQHYRSEEVDYEGEVYCVSVPNEVLYVRRNGQPAWCGNTIQPLVNVLGETPRPPAVAYQQYLYGVPRSEYMTVPLNAGDIDPGFHQDDLGEPDSKYRADQLLYLPYTQRSWTRYGFSPLEQSIIPVTTGLRRQQWRLEFFDSSTLPGLFIVAPPDWTSKQIRQLQDALNSLGNDTTMRWRHIVLPGSTTYREVRQPDLSNATDNTIYQEVLMAFDVKPLEIGLLPGGASAGLGSGEMLEGQMAASTRHSLHPLVRWLEDNIFDFVMQRIWRQPDMHFKFLGFDEPEDELKQAQTIYALIRSGLLSVDEGRQEIDRVPWGLPDTQKPVLSQLIGMGMAPPPAGSAGAPPPGAQGQQAPPQSGGEPESSQSATPSQTQATTPSSEHGASGGESSGISGGASATRSMALRPVGRNPGMAGPHSQLRPGSGLGATRPSSPHTTRGERPTVGAPISNIRSTTGAVTPSSVFGQGVDTEGRYNPYGKVDSVDTGKNFPVGDGSRTGRREDSTEAEAETSYERNQRLRAEREDEESSGGVDGADNADADSYGCILVRLPRDAADSIFRLQARIADEDFAPDGPETNPHVTVLYGLEDDTPTRIQQVVRENGLRPFTLRLGRLSYFSADEFDVLKIDVPDLSIRGLHNIFAERLEHVQTYPQYMPHITVAYVLPGTAEKYVGLPHDESQTFIADHVTYSTPAHEEFYIPLGAEEVGSRADEGAANPNLPNPSGVPTDAIKIAYSEAEKVLRREEARKLRAYLRHGNDPEKFQAVWLSQEEVGKVLRREPLDV